MILMVGWLVCLASTTSSGSEVSEGSETALLTSSASAPSTKASVAGDVQIAFEQTDDTNTPGSFFSRNWGILSLSLLAFFDVVARLTPTTKDNSIVNLLTTVINAIIPNFKKGGGRF